MCVTTIKVKYCEKHNCSHVQRGSSDRMHCRECTNERNRNTVRSQKAKENKREIDRNYQAKKRLENPDVLKQAQQKYYYSEKGKERNNYYKLKYNEGKHSVIYCIRCNQNRVYNNDYCNDCTKLLQIINNYDYISVCKHCNKEFGLDVKISNYGKVFQLNRYCSIKCNNDRIVYLRKKERKLYRYKYGKNSSHKKRVLKFGSKYENVRRDLLFKRFNYICQGCNVRCIHPNKHNYNNDNCATLDHIIPVSKKGEHTYINTQLLCRKCNSNKRDNEKYFEHKQRAKQMELQFDLTMVKHGTGEQLALFEIGLGS